MNYRVKKLIIWNNNYMIQKRVDQEYQTRWIEYCRVNRKPLYTDESMLGFIGWIRERWADWRIKNNKTREHLTKEDHDNFDEWLKTLQVREMVL